LTLFRGAFLFGAAAAFLAIGFLATGFLLIGFYIAIGKFLPTIPTPLNRPPATGFYSSYSLLLSLLSLDSSLSDDELLLLLLLSRFNNLFPPNIPLATIGWGCGT